MPEEGSGIAGHFDAGGVLVDDHLGIGERGAEFVLDLVAYFAEVFGEGR